MSWRRAGLAASLVVALRVSKETTCAIVATALYELCSHAWPADVCALRQVRECAVVPSRKLSIVNMAQDVRTPPVISWGRNPPCRGRKCSRHFSRAENMWRQRPGKVAAQAAMSYGFFLIAIARPIQWKRHQLCRKAWLLQLVPFFFLRVVCQNPLELISAIGQLFARL